MHASRRLAIPSDHQYNAPARRGAPDRSIHESQIACKSRLSRVAPASASSSVGNSSDQAMATAAAAMKSSSRWVTAHRGNLLLLPSGPVGPLANRHLHQNVEVVREGLLRGHAPSGNTAGSGWTCPREVHYGLSPATPHTCWSTLGS